MTTQTTILIAGSRALKETSANMNRLEMALDDIHCIMATSQVNWAYPGCILHGGAKGADQLAGQLARNLGLTEKIHLPNYEMHGYPYAPLKRNLEMIAKADAVIVIYAKGKVRQGGSKHVAENAVKAGKYLLELMPDGTIKHTAPAKLF